MSQIAWLLPIFSALVAQVTISLARFIFNRLHKNAMLIESKKHTALLRNIMSGIRDLKELINLTEPKG